MYKTITDLIPPDSDLPARTHALDLLGRVLNGKLYDVLGKEFHEERGANSEYIPLRQRKPSVRYNLCRTVVEDLISLLFSEGQFPTIESADHEARNGARAIVAGSGLRQVMADAAIRGSVGSVAVQMRVLKGRVFFKAFDTGYLTPSWKPDEPDRLARITERYKVRREALEAAGYTVSKDHSLGPVSADVGRGAGGLVSALAGAAGGCVGRAARGSGGRSPADGDAWAGVRAVGVDQEPAGRILDRR